MPFRTAISGMRAAQTNLETIGNNVANANTSGFKQGRAEFADIYAVSQTGIASNTPGNGVTVAQISQQFGQGNIATTDNVLDLAIDGEGFFVLEDGGSRVYSRAGAFGLDDEGYIVNAQNQRLIAYQTDASGGISGVEDPLQLSSSTAPPLATSSLNININLNANADVMAPPTAIDITDSDTYDSASTSSMTIYDSIGNSHLASFYYQKTADNSWTSQMAVDGTAVGAPQTLSFTTSGLLDTAGSSTPDVLYSPSSADPMTLSFDYTGTSQYGGGSSSAESLTQNGHPRGTFSGIDIDGDGVISANYTFGQPQVQGQVVLSRFNNPQGLVQLGDNAWVETAASGQSLRSAPNATGVGSLRSGALEDSNVDLTEQLVEMIVAQRNFQANAQVITTADTITQTIINIR